MAKREVVDRVRELTRRSGQIMGTEVYPILARNDDVKEPVARLDGIERELRRLCMEGNCPAITLCSVADVNDDMFEAGSYFLVSSRTNEEVKTVLSWHAVEDFGIEVEIIPGSFVPLLEWDPEANLVYISPDPNHMPSTD